MLDASEHLLNRIQVGRVLWECHSHQASLLKELNHCSSSMNRSVVQYDDELRPVVIILFSLHLSKALL
jgi:hypothetical protein